MKTDVTMVVDRSGSMMAIREDAEGGINHFIKDQQQHDGECALTIVQFDNEYEFVAQGVPIKDAKPYKLSPRGGTALLDAVGRAINEVGDRLSKMDAADRPELVVMVIVTDGEENSSREFTLDRVKSMIEHQQSVYSWQFVFLAANADAFAGGASLGVSFNKMAQFSPASVQTAYATTSAKLRSARSSNSVAEADAALNYSTEERMSLK